MSESGTRQPSNFSALRFPLSTLLTGDADRSEFSGVRATLESWGPVTMCPTPSDAADALQRDQLAPDLIVAAQAFPGQISHAAIARWRRLAPLARIIGLLGSWCEGEMRTGSPWPGAVRVYWHQWTPRTARQLRRMVAGRPCAWSLPPTATEEERLLVDADPAATTTRATDSRGLVLICSRSPEMAEWLSAMCRRQGFATVWQRDPASTRVEGVRAAIFDADRFDVPQRVELQRLAAALRPSPVVALMTFPRNEDRREASEAGAAAILSKPFLLDDWLELAILNRSPKTDSRLC